MAGKGHVRRKGENTQKVLENWPKFDNEFVPQWKQDLLKLKEVTHETNTKRD